MRSKPPRGVRPTTRKVLESMLASLQPRSDGARVLDLFAGTGQVGLGFLEQGASEVVFVEGHKRVAQALKKRLRETEFGPHVQVVTGRIPRVLERLTGPFDLILVDPPYEWSESTALLQATASLAQTGAVLVVEHHHKTPYQEGAGWEIERCQKFGETRLSYFLRGALPAKNPDASTHSQSDGEENGQGS